MDKNSPTPLRDSSVVAHDLNTLAARRLALGAHGMVDTRPTSKINRGHVRRVIDKLGLLQIDSVNVVCRSHYLPLYARLGPYDTNLLHRLASDGDLIEGWIHEATFLPARDHHLFDWRRRDARDLNVRPKTKKWANENSEFIEKVLTSVRERGPVSASDFEEKNQKRGPWWGWGDAKIALEWLFRTGDLGAIRANQFERRYDLMERVLPAEFHDVPVPDRDDAHRQLLTKAATHLGVATVEELGDYHRLQIGETRRHVNDLVTDGVLEQVSVQGWETPGYVPRGWTRARKNSISSLISPFDPITWHRDRAERIFGFRYRIEIYVPKPKRVYGYYVLPFVHRNGILARVDVKNDRQESVLRILSTWGEAHDDDPADTAAALANELRHLATFLGTSDIDIQNKGDLAPELARHFT